MKNLKRALSFALASVMLIGMMVVGASAVEFGDAEKIEHTDAVNTLVALNVINGKDDGNYDPEGIVTRAEMAKMITVALNGGKDLVIGTKAEPTYTDIKGNWAESYIEYCSNLGIISGRGDGTFDPNGTVTGNEAAKMMLVAMGWDSTIFNFTGANWALNVGVEANKVKLFDDLEDILPDLGLTRDDTAQLVYNGILGNTMEKSPNMSVTNGNITWDYTLVNKSIFSEKFGGLVWIGTFEGSDKNISTLSKGYIQVKGELESDDRVTGTVSFPYDFDMSNIGEEVKVLFKDGTGSKDNKPSKNDTIYGVFNTGNTTVITGILGDVKDLKDDEAQINIGGTKYDLKTSDTAADTVVTVIKNYDVSGQKTGYTTAQVKGSDAGDGVNSALTTALKAAKGDTIKAVTDSDGKVTTIYVTETKLGVVTAKNSEKVSISGIGTLTIADHEIYDGIAVDDVVNVTVLYKDKATTDGALAIVEEAEVISGEVDSYKGTESVTLDGTTYKIYDGKAMTTTGLGSKATAAFNGDDLGESFDLYMVNGYVAAAKQTSESASNYSVITAVKKNSSTSDVFAALQLQVLAADGTKTIITVSDDSDKTAYSDYAEGDIVTYTTDKSGDAIVTIEAKAGAAAAAVSYLKATKAFDGTTAANDAVYFTTDENGAYKAYNLRDLGNITVAKDTSYAVLVKNDRVVALFADNKQVPTGATSSAVYGIVTADKGTTKVDDVAKKWFTVGVNGEIYNVYLPTNSALGLKKGDIVTFNPTSDDVYADKDVTKCTASNMTVVYAEEYNTDDATLSVFTGIQKNGEAYEGTGRKVYAVADDVKIYYVDQDGDIASEAGTVPGFDTVAPVKNVALKVEAVDGVDTVKVMVVEVSGETAVINGLAAEVVNTLVDGLVQTAALPAAGGKAVLTPSAAKAWDATGSIVTEDGTVLYASNDKVVTASTASTEFYLMELAIKADAEGTTSYSVVRKVNNSEVVNKSGLTLTDGADTLYLLVGNKDYTEVTITVGANTYTLTYGTAPTEP